MRNLTMIVLCSLISTLAFIEPLPRDKTLPVIFSHPDIIKYNHDGFVINGKPVFIYSGSFHYFRCDSSDWMDRLEKIKATGFNTVQTYVAWNWHEREEGQTNFEPLEKFLDDCQKVGLYVIIRPGPYICAEWNIGGFPDWLEGKDVGFRTASAADIKWSKYWYDEVLLVIRKHLITNGGNIILMQIENEYDYFDLPDSDKVIYLKSLYETAIKNGIDVPIITCWTKQVRNNSDSVFSQIMDACNFYPGWNIESTLRSIDHMKEEEPASPPIITELQGGWFSEFGDKSVRRAEDFGPDQITGLTDYVMAHGIKALNYYMLYGGTNFGYWGSLDKTTSYDYTAPISEPGGLWDKYRSVKLIGDFIKLEGNHLINSHEIKDGARTSAKGVETLLRTDGKSGFLFVWNKNDKPSDAKVIFKTPLGSEANLTVSLEPKEAYLLPVEIPLPNGDVLHYSNVPVSAVAEVNGRPLIIAYGKPGQDASIYAGSSYCTETIPKGDAIFKCNELYVLLTTDRRAGRSRVFETNSGPVSIISDSYLTIDHGVDGNKLMVDLETRPGIDSFSVVGKISSVSIDGKPVKAGASSKTGMMSFSLRTPDFNIPTVEISNLKMESEMNAHPALTLTWKDALMKGDSVVPLDVDGDYRSGYTVYSGEINLKQKGLLKCDYYFKDWHSVLVDGKIIPGLTSSDDEDMSSQELDAGSHQIEIVYENGSWPNGDFMEQHKGLKSISYCAAGEMASLKEWKRSPTPAPLLKNDPKEASVTFDDGAWPKVNVGDGNQGFIKPNEGWWFRRHVTLTEQALSGDPTITFKAVDDNAIVYINGTLAADHHGYNTPFTISLSKFGKSGDNVIAVYVQNEAGGGGIWQPVVLKWGKSEPMNVALKYHYGLAGQIAGWQNVSFNDAGWKSVPQLQGKPSTDAITWYRGQFTSRPKPGWIIPWRLHLESTGSAQIWINGKLLGRYSSRGPQKDFYLPDGWLNMKGTNGIVLVLRSGSDGKLSPGITRAYVAPYSEYAVQKHGMEIGLQQ